LQEATKLMLLLLQAQLFSALKFWVTWRNPFPRDERGDFLDNNKSKRNIKQPMLVSLHLKYKVVQRISLLIHCYNLPLYMNVNILYCIWCFGFNFFIISIKRFWWCIY
jgi:hypothetical protein